MLNPWQPFIWNSLWRGKHFYMKKREKRFGFDAKCLLDSENVLQKEDSCKASLLSSSFCSPTLGWWHTRKIEQRKKSSNKGARKTNGIDRSFVICRLKCLRILIKAISETLIPPHWLSFLLWIISCFILSHLRSIQTEKSSPELLWEAERRSRVRI